MCSLAPAAHQRGDRLAHPHPRLTDVTADHRPARRVPRDSQAPPALREREVRRLRRVRAGLPGEVSPTSSTSASASAPPSPARSPTPCPATFAIDRKGWSPVQDRLPGAHLGAGLRRAGRRRVATRTPTGSPASPNPFPSVCGRICTHVCETECTRGQVEEPIAIAGLKRFVADNGAPADLPAPIPAVYDEKVAIVGAGPAGLTAARELARSATPRPSSRRCRWPAACSASGIPDYRLPQDTLQREIDQITALGVDLQTGQALRQRLHRRLAVRRRLQGRLPGDRPAQEQGTAASPASTSRASCARSSTCARQALGEDPTVGKRVVVIGGGDVAYDAGRSSFRHGAEQVTLACIEDERTAPATPEEKEEGAEEQVHVEYSLMPVEILGDGDDGDRREVPALLAGRAQRAGLAAAGRRSRATTSSSRPTR